MVKISFVVTKLGGKHYLNMRTAGSQPLFKAGEVVYSTDKDVATDTKIAEVKEEIRQEMRKRGVVHVIHLDD